MYSSELALQHGSTRSQCNIFIRGMVSQCDFADLFYEILTMSSKFNARIPIRNYNIFVTVLANGDKNKHYHIKYILGKSKILPLFSFLVREPNK